MKAVIGIDGSACSQVAVDLAANLPWPPASTLCVVSAVDPTSFYAPFVGLPPDVEVLESAVQSVLEHDVEEAAARLTGADRSTAHRVEIGRASTVVCQVAAKMAADLIIVGSRGHGLISSMLLGSVSAEIVDHAHRPVLVARGRSIDHLLLATDGSPNSLAAEGFVSASPLFADDHIEVVSVAERSQDWDGLATLDVAMPADWWVGVNRESRDRHEGLGADAARRLSRPGNAVETITPSGDPAQEIVRAAEQHHADLIVIGTRGNTGLRRLVLGSVARNVLVHAHCSVLVVPHLEEDVAA